MDTLGLAFFLSWEIMFLIEELSLHRFCPFLGTSFISGSTVNLRYCGTLCTMDISIAFIRISIKGRVPPSHDCSLNSQTPTPQQEDGVNEGNSHGSHSMSESLWTWLSTCMDMVKQHHGGVSLQPAHVHSLLMRKGLQVHGTSGTSQ